MSPFKSRVSADEGKIPNILGWIFFAKSIMRSFAVTVTFSVRAIVTGVFVIISSIFKLPNPVRERRLPVISKKKLNAPPNTPTILENNNTKINE